MIGSDFNLTEDDLKKVFPQKYFAKYGNHLKIIEFQKNIIEEEASKSKLKFQPRDEAKLRRIKSAMPTQQIKNVKVNYFDSFEDVIMKNKLELKKIDKFNAMLQMKLQLSPTKNNVIRSPSKIDKQLDQSVYLRMKAIEDMEFERKEKIKRKLKMQLEKNSVCKFTAKPRPSKSSARIEIKNSARTNPQKFSKTHRQLAKKLEQIALQSLERNESIQISNTKAMERDAELINSVNSAIKKSKKILQKAGVSERQEDKILKLFKRRAMIKSVCGIREQTEKKDLVQQTSRIREETKSMATLRRYDIILEKRAAMKNLQSL